MLISHNLFSYGCKLHPSPTFIPHKLDDLAGIAAFVKGDEEAFEFRDVLFGDHEKSGGFTDEVVIREDDCCSLVAIVKAIPHKSF